MIVAPALRPPVKSIVSMRFTTFCRVCLVSAIVLSASGCGEDSDAVQVNGKVTYRGEPLGKGSVTFFPAVGRPVIAALSDEGEYTAELLPGEYVVVVSVSTELPPGYKEGDPFPPPKVVLPPEYTTRVRSKLTATVSADHEQPIDFALQ